MKAIPKINKHIYKEIKEITGIDEDTIFDVVDYMWKGTSQIISESTSNAIYLRYFGTFYGKKEMVYHIEQIKTKKKTDEQPTGELQ
jgi:hypothetical protein